MIHCDIIKITMISHTRRTLMKKYVTPLLLLATILTSCTQEDEKDVVIESVTVTSTNTHTVTSTPTTTPPNPVVEEQEIISQQQEDPIEEYPIVDEQAVVEEEIPQLPFNYSEEDYMRDKDKVVSYCGTHGIEEMGTTWFTDGTTGWTQYCANEMMSQPIQQLPPYNPMKEEAQQWWSENHDNLPTFDPNSADGYGPNQEIPPFCVRFPSDTQCQ